MLDPRLEAAKGAVTSLAVTHKFGANAAVGTTAEDIWNVGGVYPWPTAAETVRIKSGGNAADTAAGVGARAVTIVGLDDSWEEVSEEVATAGASASSATTALFSRVFRAYVSDAGAYTDNNTAAVDIENTSTAQNLARIDAGIGESASSVYTVPSGKTAYLTGLQVNVESTKSVDVTLWQRPSADVVAAPFGGKLLVSKLTGVSGQARIDFDSYPSFAAKTDIWCSGVITSGTAAVEVSYDLIVTG